MSKKVLFQDYKHLVANGRKIFTGTYVIYYLPWVFQVVKPSVKKKVGDAHERNYEKRVIREIFRSLLFKEYYFLLIILVKKNNMTFIQKKAHFENAIGLLLADK